MHGHTFYISDLPVSATILTWLVYTVYCIVICKDAAGRAFSFSCSFSSLLCLLLFLLLLLFLPLFLLFLFLILLLLFCPLPPALVLSFFFSLWQPLTTNSAERITKTRWKKSEKKGLPVRNDGTISFEMSCFLTGANEFYGRVGLELGERTSTRNQ